MARSSSKKSTSTKNSNPDKSAAKKSAKGTTNANNSRNLFGLTVLKNNHRDIRQLRREAGYPSHHGNKVWNSSLLLIDYLNEFPIQKKSRVLEIGCGWGITGIYCGKQFKARVTGLDIDDSVFPFLEHHAEINGVSVDTLNLSYEKVTGKILSEFDVVIGGDICFWDELSKPLFNLAKRAKKANTRVIITDPGRPPYTEMAERCCAKLGGSLEAWSVPEPHNCSGFVLDVPA